MSKTVYIFFPAAEANPVYQGWMDQLAHPVSIVRHYDTTWTPPDDASIVITHNHYRWEELSILRRVVEQNRVPVLILADGILEYRNTFEHPDLADGAMFKPLMGHKLACVGRSQARWAEAWGNVGKCEVVGIPRFDAIHTAAKRDKPADAPWRILIATASTPWFNDVQRDEVLLSLCDVRDQVGSNPEFRGCPIQLEWRMNEELHKRLGVGSWRRKRPPLAAILGDFDAVITTPSTVQLEAALHGLPVAIIDYHNSPQLAPMAWSIPCPQQIEPVVHELLEPPPGKLFVQSALLADALEHSTPATPRMLHLIEAMIQCGQRCGSEATPLSFPPRILGDESIGFAPVQPGSRLSVLFPDNAVFQNANVERLQLELSQARAALGEYPDKFFEQRSANHRLRSYINWLRLIIRNRADSLHEITEAWQRLKDKHEPGRNE
jgi:hypothetical protein